MYLDIKWALNNRLSLEIYFSQNIVFLHARNLTCKRSKIERANDTWDDRGGEKKYSSFYLSFVE
jgi:hypothetical protein